MGGGQRGLLRWGRGEGHAGGALGRSGGGGGALDHGSGKGPIPQGDGTAAKIIAHDVVSAAIAFAVSPVAVDLLLLLVVWFDVVAAVAAVAAVAVANDLAIFPSFPKGFFIHP